MIIMSSWSWWCWGGYSWGVPASRRSLRYFVIRGSSRRRRTWFNWWISKNCHQDSSFSDCNPPPPIDHYTFSCPHDHRLILKWSWKIFSQPERFSLWTHDFCEGPTLIPNILHHLHSCHSNIMEVRRGEQERRREKVSFWIFQTH